MSFSATVMFLFFINRNISVVSKRKKYVLTSSFLKEEIDKIDVLFHLFLPVCVS